MNNNYFIIQKEQKGKWQSFTCRFTTLKKKEGMHKYEKNVLKKIIL